MTTESSLAARKPTHRKKPSTKHLIQCLRYLATQPSSFVCQQMRAALGTDTLEDGRDVRWEMGPSDVRAKIQDDMRQLYEQYQRGDHIGPNLFETLRVQLTLQCLTNLTHDGHLKAEGRVWELERELREVKKRLGDMVADGKTPGTGIAIELSSESDEEIVPPYSGTAGEAHTLDARSHTVKRPADSPDAGIARKKASLIPWEDNATSKRVHSRSSQIETRPEARRDLLRKTITLGTKHPRVPIKPGAVRIRQPARIDAWYSHLVPKSPKDWASGSLAHHEKRILSNIGYIEETVAGIPAPSPCDACRMRGYDCKVYAPDTVELYCRKVAWQACSRCIAESGPWRGGRVQCSLYTD